MQLSFSNEEFLVGAGHQPAPITSLPFVHTARRSYRLNDPVNTPDSSAKGLGLLRSLYLEKLRKPYHLEEGEVVTRLP